jgi:hypothetical protein
MHDNPNSEHPYTAMLRKHRAIIAAGLISPYGQMKRKVLSDKQKQEAEPEIPHDEDDDN